MRHQSAGKSTAGGGARLLARMQRAGWLLFASLLLAAVAAGPVAAQSSPPSEPPAIPGIGPASGAGGAEEMKPEILYLPSESGRLVPVPDLKLEEYQKLYNQVRGLVAPDPPRFVLQRLELEGRAEETHAALTARFEILLTEQARADSWVRVPLRLKSLILRGVSRHEGSGEQFLEYDAERDGYVCWLRAEPKSTHQLTLTLAAPLEVVGGMSRLNLTAPKCPTQLSLEVPHERVEAEVAQQNSNILRPVRSLGASTQLSVDGNGGELQVRWRPAPRQPDATPPRLDAIGAIRVILEGLGQVSCEAQLRIRSFGGPVDQFRVRLPPRMHLVPLDQPGYRVTVVDEVTAEGPAKGPAKGPAEKSSSTALEVERGELVEITLNTPTSSEVSVRLLMERLPEERLPEEQDESERSERSERDAGWIEAGSFDVEGAIRQRGTIDFATEGELTLDWRVGDGLTRRDDIPEATRQQGVVARFEYYRQPCSLAIRPRPKEKRVSVEPRYHFHVGGGSIRLQAALRYRVSGETAFRLRSDWSGWVVDAVDRGELATGDGVSLDEVAPLEVPVAADSRTMGEGFLVQIEAHRDYDPEADELALPFPQLLEASVAPATVIVTTAENVSLEFRSLEAQGVTLDAHAQTPLREHRFRERSGDPVRALTAALRVSPRLVTVDAASTIALGSAEPLGETGSVFTATAAIQQTWDYHVAYSPIEQVQLRLDRQWLSDDPTEMARRLRLRWSGQPVDFDVTADPAGNEKHVLLVLKLPEPALGTHQLSLQAEWPLTWADGEPSLATRIPLAIPADGEVTRLASNQLRIDAAGQFAVLIDDAGWQPVGEASRTADSAGPWSATARSAVDSVTLQLRQIRHSLSAAVRVERAWLQTMMTRFDRLDRFSFRLAPAVASVQVRLPPGADSRRLRVAVDRQPLEEIALDSSGRFTIPLPPDGPEDAHVIDLWYWFESRPPANRMMSLESPAVVGAEQAERMLWQVVVPPDEHLLVSPANATPELSWRWEGFYWAREPNLDQQQLESWIGGVHQQRLPTATNKYLFVSFGSREPLKLMVASRHLILLSVSGLVLIAGLVLIYRPALQHPAILMVLAVSLGVLGLWSPEVTLLIAQAAGLGLLLYLLGKVLDWALGGHRRRSSGLRGVSGPDSRQLPLPLPQTAPDSGATTATGRVTLPVPETEAK